MNAAIKTEPGNGLKNKNVDVLMRIFAEGSELVDSLGTPSKAAEELLKGPEEAWTEYAARAVGT